MSSPHFNFSSGPAMLPTAVMHQVHDEWFNWQGSGLSAVEWSHRAGVFEPMIHETKDLIVELLSVPDTHTVLFLQGGATLLWSLIPMNVAWGKKVGHVVTGLWSDKAEHEARKYTQSTITASSQHDGQFNDIVPPRDWAVDDQCAYVHYCSNETIQGIQFPLGEDSPENWRGAPLVCDMSSDIVSRPIHVGNYGAIYAGAQKNMGIAGLTVLIIRKDWLAIEHGNTPLIPRTLHFKTVEENLSLLNTPCTFAIYVCNLVLKWARAQGGVAGLLARNTAKANALYTYLDNSDFYTTQVAQRARSQMNVTFNIRDEALIPEWLKGAQAAGLFQLKGHRAHGGLRASIYNPMPIEGVNALLNFMDDFARKH